MSTLGPTAARHRDWVRANLKIVLALFGIPLLVIGAGGLWYLDGWLDARKCERDLQAIYRAVEMHEINHGALPRIAFYADQPLEDERSMVRVLGNYGVPPEVFRCPCSHPVVRDTGLSYVWNVDVNGLHLLQIEDPVWMVAEVSALSGEVPRPFMGRVPVLFTDGRVEWLSRVPASLRNRLEALR